MQKLFKGFISLLLLTSSHLVFAAASDCIQTASDGEAQCISANYNWRITVAAQKYKTREELVNETVSRYCNSRPTWASCYNKTTAAYNTPCYGSISHCQRHTEIYEPPIEASPPIYGQVIISGLTMTDAKLQWQIYGNNYTVSAFCPTGYSIINPNSVKSWERLCKPNYSTKTISSTQEFKPKKQTINSCIENTKGLAFNGDPVSLNSGVMTHDEEDYSLNNQSNLSINRYYNSITGDWTFNYSKNISYTENSIGQFITLTRDNGISIVYKKQSGVWVASSPNNTIGKLIDNSGSTPENLSLYSFLNENNETEFYNSNGQLIKISSLNGNNLNITYSYDSTNASNIIQLISVNDDFNNKIIISIPENPIGSCSSDRVETIKLYKNNIEQLSFNYGYNSSCKLTSVTYPNNKSLTYTYTNNKLSSITDENNSIFVKWTNSTVKDVPRNLYLISNHGFGTNGDINKNTYTYPNATTVTKTDALNKVTTLTSQNSNGFLSTSGYTTGICSDCGGFQGNNVTYDSLGNVSSYTDFNGNSYQNTYDSQSRLIQKKEAVGTPLERETNYTWHLDTRLLETKTEPVSGGNKITTYTYTDSFDANANLIKSLLTQLDITAPNNDGTSATTTRTWKYYYNSNNDLIKVENPRYVASSGTINDKVDISYIDGNVSTMTNGLNQVITFSNYNEYGSPQTIVNSNGKTTNLTYDIMGRVLTSTYESTETTTYEYDAVGQLTKMISPTGNYNKTYYDTAHRLNKIEEYDENNNYLGKTEITLDNMSNVTAMKVFDNNNVQIRISTAQYDNKNRLFKSLGALNQTDTYTYDNNSNLTNVVDAGSNTTTSTYDSLNRLSTITYPDLGVVTTTYKPDNNIATVIDQKGLTTTYTYNGFGDLIKLESPDTGTTLITYDINGNPILYEDNRHQVSTYSYDVLNRLTNISYTGHSNENVSITYDSCTNGIGKTCSITDVSGTQNFTYDSKGYLATKEYVKGIFSKTVEYMYNSVGQLTHIIYPSGKVVNYTYENDKVKAISYTENSVTTNILTNATYEAFNDVPSNFTWGNNATYAQGFNQDGLISSITSPYAYPTNKGYGFDTRYNITTMTDPSTANRSSSTTYDNKSRIADYTYGTSGNDYDYSYNSSDDRTTNIDNGGTASTYNYNSLNHRLDSITGANADSMTYDANGNILTSAGNTYTYNATNRMATSNDGTITTDYLINFNGYRTKKSNSYDTTWFIYDDIGNLIAEYDANGDVKNEYIYMDGNPVAIIKNTNLNYIYTDHLGTPRAITDVNNVLKWTWENKEAFGKNSPDENISGSNFEFNFRFPGQYFDKETNLNYNVNRDYNPNWGRYVQSDPIGLIGGINTYGYVGGNSLSDSDELGLLPSLPQGLVDFAAGYGDSASFGLTRAIRNYANWEGADKSSFCYSAGGYAEIGTNVASLGGSLYLKSLIKGLTNSQKSKIRQKITKLDSYKKHFKSGKELHHKNPLFGHPAAKGYNNYETIFPTGGLKINVHSGNWNLKSLSTSDHKDAHLLLRREESFYGVYHSGIMTGLKLENNILNQ